MLSKQQVDKAAISLRNTEKLRTELCLPAHLLFLVLEDACKKGFEVRADVLDLLNTASIVHLTGLDDLSVARVAKQVDDTARYLMKDFNVTDPAAAVLSIALFITKLVDEQLYPDPRSQAVLVALLLVDDAKDENGDSPWPVRQILYQADAGNLLARARLMGYYTQVGSIAPEAIRNTG